MKYCHTYLLLLYLVSINVYAKPMKRLLPILLACLCLLVGCNKTAIKDKTLQELVTTDKYASVQDAMDELKATMDEMVSDLEVE